jgi:tRNA threonylcarbamoyladenosine biosynthesis protein TsaE
MIELCSKSLSDLPEVAHLLVKAVSPHRIILFKGEMGAGKTTLIKSVCAALGVQGNVSSPTFSLVNEYATPAGEKIFHFDFYRIKTIREAYDMGYEEYFFSGNYCLVEWPEKIEELINFSVAIVQVEVINEIRNIKITV